MTAAFRNVEAATLARDGSPPITRTTFPTCRALCVPKTSSGNDFSFGRSKPFAHNAWFIKILRSGQRAASISVCAGSPRRQGFARPLCFEEWEEAHGKTQYQWEDARC